MNATMAKERLGKKERRRIPRWTARVIGASALATSLFIPSSTQELSSASIGFNPGISASTPEPEIAIEQPAPPPPVSGRLTRDTGIDMQPCFDFEVCGTDLGIPFVLDNGSIGYLLGDTFAVAGPHIPDLPSGADKWRSPVMIRSAAMPVQGMPIIFDSAVGLDGRGTAPEFLHNKHRSDGEISVLPNDGIGLPEIGEIKISYMSIAGGMTEDNPHWRTNYAGLAVSSDGNNFQRIDPREGAPVWMNGCYDSALDHTTLPGLVSPTGEWCDPDSPESNTDPFQMWSMQRDGDYVYIVTVRSGRQSGPMMMLRVPWDRMEEKSAYECWNGSDWGGKCQPLLPESKYGEPSIRKLSDGTWVMAYTDYTYTQIVTRTADSPNGPWSEPKIQLSWLDLNALYGGFIHPWSTKDNLVLMVSSWISKAKEEGEEQGELVRYDISHLITSA